jgi:hypothetical protein
MKTDFNHTLTGNFEVHDYRTESGIEFWLTLDLQHLRGYSKRDNFLSVVSKAKAACEVSGHGVPDHFPDASKMVGWRCPLTPPVDRLPATGYRSAHIRPVAVRPLDHPERWPTPRGFLFAGFKCRGTRLDRWGEP